MGLTCVIYSACSENHCPKEGFRGKQTCGKKMQGQVGTTHLMPAQRWDMASGKQVSLRLKGMLWEAGFHCLSASYRSVKLSRAWQCNRLVIPATGENEAGET